MRLWMVHRSCSRCAWISYVDWRSELFRAMLLMRFNDAGKIILWHEVYVPVALPA